MGDGWSIAWRVLDAQYWGVPQRRRRIFLVADFGGQSAPEVLFKREGLRRHIAKIGEEREGIAANAKGSTYTASRGAYCIQGNCIDRADTAGCNGKGWTEDVCYTLNTIDRPAVATYQKVTGPLMANSHPGSYTGQDAYTDMLIAHPTYSLDRAAFNQGENAQYDFSINDDNTCQTLVSRGPNAVAKSPCYSVRRLTPLECERLQNYPDFWTDIEGASDSARYKADGNSVAVCCPEYVLEGIKEVIERGQIS